MARAIVPHACSRRQWLLILRSDAPPDSVSSREDTVEEGEGAVEDGDDASMDEGLAG